MKIKIVKLCPVKTPDYGTAGSAGLDFYAPDGMPETYILPGGNVLIASGIAVNLPAGVHLLAVDKSGVAHRKGLLLGAKLIDSDYIGEIFINFINTGTRTAVVRPGEKLAQFIVLQSPRIDIEEVAEIEKVTERGSGGFGSTNTL